MILQQMMDKPTPKKRKGKFNKKNLRLLKAHGGREISGPSDFRHKITVQKEDQYFDGKRGKRLQSSPDTPPTSPGYPRLRAIAYPLDGVKGKTWGPSVTNKPRQRASWYFEGGKRFARSAPNLEKSLKYLGGHSNIGALQEMDYEDDEWPEELGGGASSRVLGGSHSSSLPYQAANGSAHEVEALKRFAERKKTDVCLYNMSSHLAAVALGFDVRRTNDSFGNVKAAASGDVAGADKVATADNKSSSRKRESHIGNRRDAYLAAVKDNFLHEASDLSELQDYSSTSGYRHNTYHGATTRARPTVNFDVPMRFTETNLYENVVVDAAAGGQSVTPSSDQRLTSTPGTDGSGSAMTPGTSYSGASSMSPAPGSDDLYNDLALISLSPSQDKQFIRQFSDTSSSAYETPSSTTPKSTPSRLDSLNQNSSVRFSEDTSYSPSIRSPAVKFNDQLDFGLEDNALSASVHGSDVTTTLIGGETPSPLPPPPSRRDSTPINQATAERPVTLDIIARPRARSGILKKPSPAHSNTTYKSTGKATTQAGIDSSPTVGSGGGGGVGGDSLRSGITPGSTPQRTRDETNLLDIDVEGQRDDPTRPLATKRQLTSQTVIQQHL